MCDEGEKICPLCTEEMDLTDRQLKPCKCGYEICVWCWHHIMDMAEKDVTDGRCPACRTPYDKEKIVGMAANCGRLVAEVNSERKLRSQKAKPKTSEGRKHLSSVRVIQRNLVYIIGMPSNLADEEALQFREYFGQYGKVLKVSISRTTGGAIQHSSNNTFSVYVTFSKEEEAIRCIQSVHGFILEGSPLRACFGTTKYCHAWLRSMTCTNPDCLYLHDIGTQEDSFTKDEIISAYTRSRVQQITGATNNQQRRSGNMLPPPIDDYCSTGTTSGKPTVRSASNHNPNPVSQAKVSPPNDKSARSIALPPAASWGTRVSNGRPPAASSVYPDEPTNQKPDMLNGSVVPPSVVASATQTSILYSEIGKKSMVPIEINPRNYNDRSESSKQYLGSDYCSTASDASAEAVSEASVSITSGDQLSCVSASRDTDRGSTILPNSTSPLDLDRQSLSWSDNDGNVAALGSIESSCSGLVSEGSHLGVEQSDTIRPNTLLPNHLPFRLAGNQRLQQPYIEQCSDPLSSSSSQKFVAISDGCVSREPLDWRSESKVQEPQVALNEVDQRPKASEDTSYMLNSSSSQKIPNDSSGHSWKNSDIFCSTDNHGSADLRAGLTEFEGASFPYASATSILSNGYNSSKLSSSTDSDRNFDFSNMFSNVEKGKYSRRLSDDIADVGKSASLDMGESSIISNILSLDNDSWDDSLTSPHNLAKLLSETDDRHGSHKASSTWKSQNSNQSRFLFARQEDFSNQGTNLETSFSSMSLVQKRYSIGQDSVESRDPYFDTLQNTFPSSNLDEFDTFPSSHSVISSHKLSGSRAQFSAPPGFSVPSRAPPPGFSSQERVDQPFDTTSTNVNHLLQNSLNQYSLPSAGNIGNLGDVEFIDPAILAVGKGRLPNGYNNSSLDMRSIFPPQFSASENDLRLQLLMQQSVSPHQNMRFSDHVADSPHQNMRFSDHVADRFSPLNGAYNIPSRLLEQAHASNLSSFGQLSLQQSRNGHMSNGHWDGWNGVQTGNGLSMAELVRNERLGFNKFSPSYEDLQFRVPNSGNLYNRAFGL